jgi:hypothetical protein
MGIHRSIAKRRKFPLLTGILSDSQSAPGIGHMGGKFQIRNAKRCRELTQAPFQLRQPFARNTVGNGSSPWRCFGVELKSPPVNLDNILVLQPDQAALLRNEAIRSHKV